MSTKLNDIFTPFLLFTLLILTYYLKWSTCDFFGSYIDGVFQIVIEYLLFFNRFLFADF